MQRYVRYRAIPALPQRIGRLSGWHCRTATTDSRAGTN
jgi:hypothetical protein